MVVFGILAIILPLAHNPVLVWFSASANIVAPNEQTNEYIYNVSFLNIGKAVADDVTCALSFSNANITAHSYEMNPESLKSLANETYDANHYEVAVRYLNQNQGGSLAVRAEPYQSTAPNPPEVSLYGHNINGKQSLFSTAGKVTLWKVAVPTSLFVIAALIVTWWVTNRHRKPKDGT